MLNTRQHALASTAFKLPKPLLMREGLYLAVAVKKAYDDVDMRHIVLKFELCLCQRLYVGYIELKS